MRKGKFVVSRNRQLDYPSSYEATATTRMCNTQGSRPRTGTSRRGNSIGEMKVQSGKVTFICDAFAPKKSIASKSGIKVE